MSKIRLQWASAGRGLPSFLCLSLPAFPVATYGRTGYKKFALTTLLFNTLFDFLYKLGSTSSSCQIVGCSYVRGMSC